MGCRHAGVGVWGLGRAGSRCCICSVAPCNMVLEARRAALRPHPLPLPSHPSPRCGPMPTSRCTRGRSYCRTLRAQPSSACPSSGGGWVASWVGVCAIASATGGECPRRRGAAAAGVLEERAAPLLPPGALLPAACHPAPACLLASPATACCAACPPGPPCCSPQNISNFLWAFAKLGVHSPELFMQGKAAPACPPWCFRTQVAALD